MRLAKADSFKYLSLRCAGVLRHGPTGTAKLCVAILTGLGDCRLTLRRLNEKRGRVENEPRWGCRRSILACEREAWA
ncbi:hypothetical protein LIA77_10175 [Sarocladium implicatum]|nr:hypothetical protein LIA77_10175 [Sarocladium implicatum]